MNELSPLMLDIYNKIAIDIYNALIAKCFKLIVNKYTLATSFIQHWQKLF